MIYPNENTKVTNSTNNNDDGTDDDNDNNNSNYGDSHSFFKWRTKKSS
jgi:hypothetical protein